MPALRPPNLCSLRHVCPNTIHQSRPLLARNFIYRAYSNGGARSRPPRLAVIGSGPAGFYSAYRLLNKIPDAVVDMYERLPVPYGLVRFGVAPDHPEVKNCQDKFEEVALSPRFNFVGNIGVGADVPLASLKPHYDAILFSYGASQDRELGIPGESLGGVYSARAFVGWYNGLPQYSTLNPNLEAGEDAVVIGQGNVALDVARILLSDVDALRKTDITEHALDALLKSKVRSVRVVGRRGPMQAAYTIKEVRELMNLPSVAFSPIEPGLLPPDGVKLPRAQKRIVDVLKKGSSTSAASATRSWRLDYFLLPTAFTSSPDKPDYVNSVSFNKTTFDPSADPLDPKAPVQPTDASLALPASLAFRSVGYKSTAIPGLELLGATFDSRRGIIPNDGFGRAVSPARDDSDALKAAPVPGVYCAGWVKKGPTGVIASTMMDAFTSADTIVQDWENHSTPFLNHDSGGSTGLGWDGIKAEIERKGLRRVSWEDWKAIDQAEKARGQKLGKEREKFTSVDDMLKVLNGP